MLEIGKTYQVTVEKIINMGLIVKTSDSDETYLIHISKLSHGFIENIYDYANVGDTLQALCVEGLGKPELSIKALQPKYEVHKRHSKPNNRTQTMKQESKTPKNIEDMITQANFVLRDKLGNNAMELRKRRIGGRKDNYYE